MIHLVTVVLHYIFIVTKYEFIWFKTDLKQKYWIKFFEGLLFIMLTVPKKNKKYMYYIVLVNVCLPVFYLP